MNLAVKLYSSTTNPLGVPGVWPAQLEELGDSTTLPDATWVLMTLEEYNNYITINKPAYDAWFVPYMASLPSNMAPVQTFAISSQPEPLPFAQPTYRTKRDATPEWQVCLESTIAVEDLILTEERYISGGRLIFHNTKEGDYITAEVRDSDPGVIPSQYRNVLCEDYPIVAKYVVKKWLKPVDGYDDIIIDTYPLNAKISSGLILRISFHASDIAGERKFAVNYHLTKKL